MWKRRQTLLTAAIAFVCLCPCGSPSKADSFFEICYKKYESAKAANSLNGSTWIQFYTKCSTPLRAAAKAAPSASTNATNLSGGDPPPCPCKYRLPGLPWVSSSKPIPPRFRECLKYASKLIDITHADISLPVQSDDVVVEHNVDVTVFNIYRKIDWGVPPQAEARQGLVGIPADTSRIKSEIATNKRQSREDELPHLRDQLIRNQLETKYLQCVLDLGLPPTIAK